MPIKITLIGAGSVVFAKTLVGDILQCPALADSHICLMDIDPARLKVAKVMMDKLAAKLRAPAKITATLDRREAIRGAKYVICTVQVGGYKPSTVRDFQIPAKYGLKQTIADTLGIGGIFRGLRTIPVVNAIARDIAEVGHPDCLLLNYTNPMAINCWAVNKAVGIPCVGLCHSVFFTARMLAGHIGVPYEDINYQVAGINHMAFFLKFEYRGQDLYPLLFRVLEDPARNFERVRYEMMRRIGYFVTESSEHQSEYVPYFIHHGEKVIRKFDIPIDEYIRRCEAIDETWHTTQANLLGAGRDIDVPKPSEEYGSHIIQARETNMAKTVYGNVPNGGAIENLPGDCCVEVPCLADANGLSPVHVGRLPEQLAALCLTNINPQRLTVEAALTGKREYIYQAAMLDPHTAASLTLDKIWALCDELIEAHQKDGYLGEFAPVVKNTGRGYAGFGDRPIARLHVEQCDLSAADSPIRLRLDAENPSDKARALDFELKTDAEKIAIPAGRSRFSLKIPARKKIARTIVLRLRQSGCEKIPVDLVCRQSGALAIGAVLRLRRRIAAGEDGRAHFACNLSGIPAVEGFLRGNGRVLEADITVNDSDIKLNHKDPGSGSSVCLMLAQNDAAPIARIFLAPGDRRRKAAAFTPDGKWIPEICVAFSKNKTGYRMVAKIPAAKAGLSDAKRFLFDSVARLNALGQAHSGGRCALGETLDGHENTVGYAQAVL